MSYSCCDFTDDVCSALGVELPADADDGDVAILSELACEEIERLKKIEALWDDLTENE